MTAPKNKRPITEKQLWFIWKTITELDDFLGNQTEGGAMGTKKYHRMADKARDIIQTERVRLKHETSKRKGN